MQPWKHFCKNITFDRIHKCEEKRSFSYSIYFPWINTFWPYGGFCTKKSWSLVNQAKSGIILFMDIIFYIILYVPNVIIIYTWSRDESLCTKPAYYDNRLHDYRDNNEHSWPQNDPHLKMNLMELNNFHPLKYQLTDPVIFLQEAWRYSHFFYISTAGQLYPFAISSHLHTPLPKPYFFFHYLLPVFVLYSTNKLLDVRLYWEDGFPPIEQFLDHLEGFIIKKHSQHRNYVSHKITAYREKWSLANNQAELHHLPNVYNRQ